MRRVRYRVEAAERADRPPASARRDAPAINEDAPTTQEDAPTIATLDDAPTRVAYDETPTRMYSHSAPPGVLPPVARAAFASRPPGSLPPVTQAFEDSAQYAYAAEPYASSPGNDAHAPFAGGTLPLPTTTSRATAPVARAGLAGGEGSGLIDIRALASLAQSRTNGHAASIAAQHGAQPGARYDDNESGDEREADPLASFGTGHGVAFAALDSLAPVANRERPKDATIPLAILTGAAMIAAAAFAAVYITRAPALPPAMASAAQPSAPAAPATITAQPQAPAGSFAEPAEVLEEPAAQGAAPTPEPSLASAPDAGE